MCNPIRTLIGAAVGHASVSSSRCDANAALTADEADSNTAAIPSPMDENTTPSCSATVLRSSSSWRDSAARMAVSSSCHRRVEPSMSVNRNVTVPDGAAHGHSIPRSPLSALDKAPNVNHLPERRSISPSSARRPASTTTPKTKQNAHAEQRPQERSCSV